MAKKPNSGKCVHCLADFEEGSWDHMFPKSWYPDATPENLEKWKIPSCVKCNQRYSKIEGDLLSRVGLALDPHNPASASIVQAALRSLKASAGRDERDAAMRAARGKKIMGEMLRGEKIPPESVLPGMGNRWNVPVEEQVGVKAPGSENTTTVFPANKSDVFTLFQSLFSRTRNVTSGTRLPSRFFSSLLIITHLLGFQLQVTANLRLTSLGYAGAADRSNALMRWD